MPTTPKTIPDGLRRAAKAYGDRAKLARALKITPQAIGQWKTVPRRHIAKIERLTGVPRHLLAPDLYAPPSKN